MFLEKSLVFNIKKMLVRFTETFAEWQFKKSLPYGLSVLNNGKQTT